jgi:hypothetical protein
MGFCSGMLHGAALDARADQERSTYLCLANFSGSITPLSLDTLMEVLRNIEYCPTVQKSSHHPLHLIVPQAMTGCHKLSTQNHKQSTCFAPSLCP